MLNTFLKTQECLITTFEVFQLFFSFGAENNTEKRKKDFKNNVSGFGYECMLYTNPYLWDFKWLPIFAMFCLSLFFFLRVDKLITANSLKLWEAFQYTDFRIRCSVVEKRLIQLKFFWPMHFFDGSLIVLSSYLDLLVIWHNCSQMAQFLALVTAVKSKW